MLLQYDAQEFHRQDGRAAPYKARTRATFGFHRIGKVPVRTLPFGLHGGSIRVCGFLEQVPLRGKVLHLGIALVTIRRNYDKQGLTDFTRGFQIVDVLDGVRRLDGIKDDCLCGNVPNTAAYR